MQLQTPCFADRNIHQFMEKLLNPCSFLCLVTIVLFSHLHSIDAADRNTYIVHVQLPNVTLDRVSWYRSFLSAVTSEQNLIHSYINVASAFAAKLTDTELGLLSVLPGFVQAYPDTFYELQTTHTPDFLGLHLRQGTWKESNYGKGVIVGVLDTGIFPDHPSFSGAGIPRPPAKWKGRCDFKPSSCNNKLIGARAFLGGSAAASPIDNNGHGTHTASTAAGARVPGAQVLGNAYGTATGIAPLAHVAMYKVCADSSCAGSDIMAGIDAAVSDGVDVLSISLSGGPTSFFADPVLLGAYAAAEHGVFVSCSAGNRGPSASTVANGAPWVLTVAASTIDRNIRVTVRLGNGQTFKGESLYQPRSYTPTFHPLAYAALCESGSFDGVDVKGKIVLCERGGFTGGPQKSLAVKNAGGVGMILMNQERDGYTTFAEANALPASHVSFADGDRIKAYITSAANPRAELLFRGTILGTSPAPVIASFSSRGPNWPSPGILKPDITGPGVNILAAWPFAVGPPSDSTAVTFNIISGTSMSAPHLSGVAALIKSVHPKWSPAAIKSAIITTATVVDTNKKPISDEQLRPASLFALGAGHVNTVIVTHPGLVYDVTARDYTGYLCGLGYSNSQVGMIVRKPVRCESVGKIPEKDLNYPTISVSFNGNVTQVTVKRTVKNVGEAVSTYVASVGAPKGVKIRVVPSQLHFTAVNQERKFQVVFQVSGGGGGARVAQGYLKWVSSKHVVRSPISITFQN